MSSINVLRENKAKYERRRNNSRNRRNNPSATNNNKKKYSKHFNHYNKLVKGYTKLIKKREDAELANLERDANNAVETINEPNNISPELRAQLNNLAVHRRYVDNVSNILAGKGTRKRKNRRPRRNRRGQQNRVTQNSNKQNNNSCQQRSINGACILGGIGAGAAIGGIPGACVGGVCGAAAAVGRRFMGGKTRKKKRKGKKGTRKKYKR